MTGLFADDFIYVSSVEEDKVLIILGGKGIQMSRVEAERLFVDLGHTLQDMDVNKYSDESMLDD